MTGLTLDAVPAGPTSRWDRASNFRVQLDGGALESLSDLAVLAGGNAAAIRTGDGVWEVVQFAQAELVGDKIWRLSRLLRGQAGSEYAMAPALAAGATFVLLNTALVPIARGRDALERPLQLRIAAAGVGYDDPSTVALTLTPRPTALMPLAPVQLRAVRQADGVHVSWKRRTRIDGDGWSGEVPLGEEAESYALDVLAGGVPIRSIACTSPQAVYANANELADFGGVQASLTLRVAQLSQAVGAGHPTQLTIQV